MEYDIFIFSTFQTFRYDYYNNLPISLGCRASLWLEKWENVGISFPASLAAQEWTGHLGSMNRYLHGTQELEIRSGHPWRWSRCGERLASWHRKGNIAGFCGCSADQFCAVVWDTAPGFMAPSLVLLPTYQLCRYPNILSTNFFPSKVNQCCLMLLAIKNSDIGLSSDYFYTYIHRCVINIYTVEISTYVNIYEICIYVHKYIY